MKQNLLIRMAVFVAAMMMCLGSSAIDKVIKKSEMTGEITSVEDLASATFMLQNGEGDEAVVLYTPSGWDIKVAPLATAAAKNDNGGFYKLEAIGDHYLIPVFNIDQSVRTFWSGAQQYVNSQPVSMGTVIFGLSGAAPQYGQDAQDHALWDITYEEGQGFVFHCVGRDIYIGHNGTAAFASSDVFYWKAYTGYILGYDETEVLAAYDVVEAAVKTTDTSTTLSNAKAAYDEGGTLDAFGDAVNAAIDAVNECEAVNAAYANLEGEAATIAADVLDQYNNGEFANVAELRAAYIVAIKAQTTPGSDFTGAIINPSFETGTIEGWTSNNCGDVANNYNFGARTGDKFCERWTNAPGTLSDGTFLQTLSGMPNGKYKLTAELQNREQGNGDAAGKGFFLVANEGKTEGVTNNGATITTYGVVTDGTLEIGVKLEGCTGNWICFDNFQLTYLGAGGSQEEPGSVVSEMAIDVERIAGRGYMAQDVEYNEYEILAVLGVESWDAIETMYPVVMTTGEAGEDYDGWRNVDGDPTTWNGEGTDIGLCLKYPHDGSFMLCTHPGNDPEIGETLTAAWVLTAGEKSVIVKVNVTFVEEFVTDLTFDDLNQVGDDVVVSFNSKLGACYEGYTASVDVEEILATLGSESLSSVDIYAVQSDGSLDSNYKYGLTDGWRNAAGDWESWGSNARICVKADFSADENQIYYIGGMSGQTTEPATYMATYAFVKQGTNDAVLLYVKLNYGENPATLIDVTDYIVNPQFNDGMEGWDYWGHDIPEYGELWTTWHTYSSSYSNGDSWLSYFVERWVYVGTTLEDGCLSQDIEDIPNGKYRLEADIIACQQDGTKDGELGTYLFAESGEVHNAVKTFTGNGVPQHYSVDVVVRDEHLRIGFETMNSQMNWIAADNFRLFYLGNDGDESDYVEEVGSEDIYLSMPAFIGNWDDEYYPNVSFTLDMDYIAEALGVSVDEIKVYAPDADGMFTSASSAKNGGFWFSQDGVWTAWRDNCAIFVEPVSWGNMYEWRSGQYPNVYEPGETGFATVYLFGGNKYYTVNVFMDIEENLTEILLGDANCDGIVDIVDVTTLVDFILYRQYPNNAQWNNGDVNGDGYIDVVDLTSTVQIILGVYNNYNMYGTRAKSRTVTSDALTVEENSISLENSRDYVGFQMDVTVSDDAQFRGVQLSDRCEDHSVTYSRIAENTYRIVSYSVSGTPFNGNAGTLLNVNLAGGSVKSISNAVFSNGSRGFAIEGGDGTTNLDEIANGESDQAEYYDLSGRRVTTIKKGGIYIKKGGKVLVK